MGEGSLSQDSINSLVLESSDDPTPGEDQRVATQSIFSGHKGARLLVRKIYNGWLKHELKRLLHLSVPLTISLLFQFSLLWVSLLFLGHLPTKEDLSYKYAAAGLGSSFLNVTGLALGMGVATATDTLCSQAYGYKNYKRVGVILQRSILIISLLLFPIWVAWLNTESLLLLVQQEPCIAKYAAIYVRLFTLALPFLFLDILLQHYLQAQSIVWQFAFIGFLSNCVSVVLHAVLIYGFKLGFIGAVIALVISNSLPSLMVIVYIWLRKLHRETWDGWSFECLEEWRLFIKLALPGLLMNVLEWWGFETVSFFAGALSETELAANVVWFQIIVILYMPCVGISIATSVRVGNELGAGNPQGAKRATYTSLIIVLILAIASSIFLLSTKDVIATIFVKKNEAIAQEVSRLMYVASIFVISDQTQTVVGGMLRGSGRQYIGAIMNFVAYFIIGLPIGVVLGFKTELRLIGIWIGLLLGSITHCSVFLVVLVCTNWKKESEKAMRRAQGGETKEADTTIQVTENGVVQTELTQSENSSLSSSEEAFTADTDVLLISEDVENPDTRESEEDQKITTTSHSGRSSSYKIKKFLIHGSFYVIGVCILICGAAVSYVHPHVDPEEYSNCTAAVAYHNFSVSDYGSGSGFS